MLNDEALARFTQWTSEAMKRHREEKEARLPYRLSQGEVEEEIREGINEDLDRMQKIVERVLRLHTKPNAEIDRLLDEMEKELLDSTVYRIDEDYKTALRNYRLSIAHAAPVNDVDIFDDRFRFTLPDDKVFVSVYSVTQEYGGPEEGGWYYDNAILELTLPTLRSGAEDLKEELLGRPEYALPVDKFGKVIPLSSVRNPTHHQVYIEDRPGCGATKSRPHYC